jgi:catechol 2,3-dioxygenase-like lactoylglutathione lyase family enzyme
MTDEIVRLLDDYDRGRVSRRTLLAALAFGLAAPALGRGASQDEARDDVPPTFGALEVDHVALRVTDVARSRDFYRRHLGLTVTSNSRRSCFLNCGEGDFLALFQSETPGLDHFCFAVPEYDPADAVQRLTEAGLDPDRQENRVYFKDPDGIRLQVARRARRRTTGADSG